MPHVGVSRCDGHHEMVDFIAGGECAEGDGCRRRKRRSCLLNSTCGTISTQGRTAMATAVIAKTGLMVVALLVTVSSTSAQNLPQMISPNAAHVKCGPWIICAPYMAPPLQLLWECHADSTLTDLPSPQVLQQWLSLCLSNPGLSIEKSAARTVNGVGQQASVPKEKIGRRLSQPARINDIGRAPSRP